MGRRHVSISTFSPHDSNTLCDVTNFKVKKSQVLRRWEGFFVLPEAWHPRHPQDKPVVPKPQRVYSDIRTQTEDETAAASFTTI
jgi:hypothetical protein